MLPAVTFLGPAVTPEVEAASQMGFFVRTLCLVVSAASSGSPASAQGVRADLLPPLGTVVRVTLGSADDETTAAGVLSEASPSGLVLEADEGRHVYRIPAEALLGLDVSRGRNHGRGAVLGLVYGALGTGLVLGGTAALLASGGGGNCCSRGTNFLLGGVLGAGIGGLVGLVVGGAIGTAEWETVW
jgi:hypothetical protein